MGGSSEEWGSLAAFDAGMADVWDAAIALPEPGEEPLLDALVERKRITIGDLVRVGARKVEGAPTLVFAGDRGLKFRSLDPHAPRERWSANGSEWPTLRVVGAREPSDPATVIVCEGETDAARLSALYPGCDVAIQQSGAADVRPTFRQQVDGYDRVLIALDKDEAGHLGWTKWQELTQGATRFPAPGDADDWCEWDGTDPPPLPDPPPEAVGKLLVSAGELLELEVPEVISWFEHAVLPVGGLMIVHGWIKSFKSYIAFDMLGALAQQRDWCGFEPTEEAIKVCAIQYEIPWPYYQKRVAAMRRHAIHPDRFGENYFTWDPLRRPTLAAGHRETEDEVLRSLDEAGIQVVLVDPIRRLVRSIRSKEASWERESQVALAFFERLQALGITVIATHHDSKSYAKSGGGDPLGITGAGAWGGDPDTIVSIALPEGDDYSSSNRRNLQFTFRNAPPIGARGVLLTGTDDDDTEIVYSPSPFGELDLDEPEGGQPQI